jgi:hypothetical protein
MVFVCIGFLLGLVDGAALVLGRTIKTIEFEVLSLGAIDHVMSGSGWDHDRKASATVFCCPSSTTTPLPTSNLMN